MTGGSKFYASARRRFGLHVQGIPSSGRQWRRRDDASVSNPRAPAYEGRVKDKCAKEAAVMLWKTEAKETEWQTGTAPSLAADS
jgi:hypothetical protein